MRHIKTLDRKVYDRVMEQVADMQHKVGRSYVTAVLLTLARWTRSDDIVDLTINQIADETAFSKSQIQRSIDAATRANVLETLSRGGSSNHRGSRRLWKLCATNSTPVEEPAGGGNWTPADSNSTPSDQISAPLGMRSLKESQRSSPPKADLKTRNPRTGNIESMIVLRREERHAGAIRHLGAWRARVRCDVHVSLSAHIEDLIRRFPNAPDATIADAAESGDNRCLAPYVEPQNQEDGELTVHEADHRDVIEQWSKDWLTREPATPMCHEPPSH